MPTTVPELIVKQLMVTGFTTVTANPTILDTVWAGMEADDLTSMKAVYAERPPNVVTGYAREKGPFPQIAITLQADNTLQDYIGIGEYYEDDPDIEDHIMVKRNKGTFGIFIYAQHPEVAVAYYRLARHILNVASKALIAAGLEEPALSGAELAPDPRYIPDNLFVRRLSLTFEYEECWSMTDVLATALGDVDTRLSADGELIIVHEDNDLDPAPTGDVSPYTPEES